MIKKILSILLAISMLCTIPASVSCAYEYEIVDQYGNLLDPEPAPSSALAKVRVKVYENYNYAFQVVRLVNKERKKYGLKPLTMDKSLLDSAMLRAAELVLLYDSGHLRPQGTYFFTLNHKMTAENIQVGTSSAKSAVSVWMNSPGHRANILSEDVTAIGVGCVKYGGSYYWVQDFGPTKTKKAVSTGYKNKNKTRTIGVDKYDKSLRPIITLSKTKIKVKKYATVKVQWDNHYKRITLKNSGLVIESSNPKVCKVKNGRLYGVKKGTAKIRFYYPGNKPRAVTKTVKVI